ncbi:MAG: surA [Verrucomicrobiales bacterium]|jgi:peptidyl-prolyl cis-trans isomerase SurA|nr:surA [Verrucomicrobiales bacterium]
MRKLSTFLILAASLLISGTAARAETLNRIVVVVNENVVTEQEINQSLAPVANIIIQQYRNDTNTLYRKLDEARMEKIQDLIERRLVLREFKDAGYNLPDSIVEDIIKERITKQFGDRVTLVKTLHENGSNYEKFKREQREDVIIGAMRNTHVSRDKVIISPHKIQTYYETNQAKYKVADQVKLRMIILNKTGDNAQSAPKVAGEITKKLDEGASFAEMASIYSDGSQRAQGGDRGWISRTDFKKELSDVAFSLKTGEHSGIVDLPEACYILYAEEARPAHLRDISEVRDEVEEILKADELTRLHKQWVDRLAKKSFVRFLY